MGPMWISRQCWISRQGREYRQDGYQRRQYMSEKRPILRQPTCSPARHRLALFKIFLRT